MKEKTFKILLFAYSFMILSNMMGGFALTVVYIRVTQNYAIGALIAAIATAGSIVGKLVGGVLADRFPKKLVLTLAVLIAGLSWLAIALISNSGIYDALPWSLTTLLATFSSSIAGTTESTAIRQIVTSNQMASAMSIMQARGYTASFLGPIAGGALASINFALPFYVVSALAFLSAGLLIPAWGDERLGQSYSGEEKGIHMALGGLKYIAGQPLLWGYLLTAFIVPFGLTGSIEIFIFGLAHDQSVAPWLISSIPVAIGIGGVIGSLTVPLILKKFSYPAGLATVVVLTAAAGLFTFMGLVPNWPLRIGAMVLVAALMPLTNPFFAFAMAYIPAEKQGRAMSIINSVNSLPGILTPVIAAALLPFFGFKSLVVCSIAVLLSVLTILLNPKLRCIPAQSGWSTYIEKIS